LYSGKISLAPHFELPLQVPLAPQITRLSLPVHDVSHDSFWYDLFEPWMNRVPQQIFPPEQSSGPSHATSTPYPQVAPGAMH